MFVIHGFVLIIVEGNGGKLDVAGQARAGAACRSVRVEIRGMASHLTYGTGHAKRGQCVVLGTQTTLVGYLILVTYRFAHLRRKARHVQPKGCVEDDQRRVILSGHEVSALPRQSYHNERAYVQGDPER